MWIVGLASARGLLLVTWLWVYLFAALALLSVADVLFGMKCYHLHEGCLASFGGVVALLEGRGTVALTLIWIIVGLWLEWADLDMRWRSGCFSVVRR